MALSEAQQTQLALAATHTLAAIEAHLAMTRTLSTSEGNARGFHRSASALRSAGAILGANLRELNDDHDRQQSEST